MVELLEHQLPWPVGGLLLGLCVVALYALINRPLGATGAYDAVLRVLQGRDSERWRVWFFVGWVVGALLIAVARGELGLSLAYGRLGELVPLEYLVPLLFVAGALMGYGARWSGGCTSGNGLRGCIALSPSSIAATATFVSVAIVVTRIVHTVTGGEL